MRKLLSTKYSAGAFNTAMLLLRLTVGILMMMHGYEKLINFEKILNTPPGFMNFLGIGTNTSLALLVFAEFFCSIFLILGLFTRLATIPLIIATCVMVFVAHKGLVFTEGDRKSTRLNSSHSDLSRMPSSA